MYSFRLCQSFSAVARGQGHGPVWKPLSEIVFGSLEQKIVLLDNGY